MKDCFVLRFNLENAVNPNTKDRTGALAAMFDIDKAELEESVIYYENRLMELVGGVNKMLVESAKKMFSGKKIAIFGDSLTSDRLSYANIIKELGIFEKVDIFAVSGSVSSQTIRGFKEKINSKNYDMVSIFIGTNDSALTDVDLPFVSVSEFERNISYACDVIYNVGANGVIFKLPCHSERTLSSGKTVTEDYNAAICKVALRNGFTLLDLNQTELKFIDDNVHFTDLTQKNIAELFLTKLQEK